MLLTFTLRHKFSNIRHDHSQLTHSFSHLALTVHQSRRFVNRTTDLPMGWVDIQIETDGRHSPIISSLLYGLRQLVLTFKYSTFDIT